MLLKRLSRNNSSSCKRIAFGWFLFAVFVLATLSVGSAETLRDEKVLSELKLRASKNYQGANVKGTIAAKKHFKKVIAMKKSVAYTNGNVEEEKNPVDTVSDVQESVDHSDTSEQQSDSQTKTDVENDSNDGWLEDKPGVLKSVSRESLVPARHYYDLLMLKMH